MTFCRKQRFEIWYSEQPATNIPVAGPDEVCEGSNNMMHESDGWENWIEDIEAINNRFGQEQFFSPCRQAGAFQTEQKE